MGYLLNGLINKKPKLKAARLDQYGQPGHNILYVTGLSGSGKSTYSKELAKKLKAEVVELDSYYGAKPNDSQSDFHRYLSKNQVNTKRLVANKKLNYNESDKIYGLLKEYAKDRRVIAEGVQLFDGTMAEKNKLRSDLSQEPILSLQVSRRKALRRAKERDQANWANVNLKEKKKEWRTQNNNKKEFEWAMGLKRKHQDPFK